MDTTFTKRGHTVSKDISEGEYALYAFVLLISGAIMAAIVVNSLEEGERKKMQPDPCSYAKRTTTVVPIDIARDESRWYMDDEQLKIWRRGVCKTCGLRADTQNGVKTCTLGHTEAAAN